MAGAEEANAGKWAIWGESNARGAKSKEPEEADASRLAGKPKVTERAKCGEGSKRGDGKYRDERNKKYERGKKNER